MIYFIFIEYSKKYNEYILFNGGSNITQDIAVSIIYIYKDQRAKPLIASYSLKQSMYYPFRVAFIGGSNIPIWVQYL